MTEKEALFEYCLRIADNDLILGHRLSEWCGHGPVLEQDIALINISLDLLGQATSLLKYAGEVEGEGRSEDDLAYLRTERNYRNVLLVEQPNGHFGDTIVRQCIFDLFHYYFLEQLLNSADPMLAGIAEKSLKEVTYHLKFSSEWLIRLGDGTEESHERVQTSLNDLWIYHAELFEQDALDERMVQAGIGVDLKKVQKQWEEKMNELLRRATLAQPEEKWGISGGRSGRHSEHLGYILADLQYLQRTYPGAEW